MARIAQNTLLSLLISVILGVTSLSVCTSVLASDFPDELPDPATVNAFKQYWGAFDAYERRLLKDGAAKYQKQWDEIKRTNDKEQAKLTKEKVDALKKGAKNYRKHLDEFPNAANKPFVILNMAQVLNLLGTILDEQDNKAGNFAKTEALAYLRDIDESFPAFVHRDEASYLRATILEELGRKNEARPIWKKLSASDRPSLHAAHANIALGDFEFEAGNAKEALALFERAAAIMAGAGDEIAASEILRVNYRVAWAAYKAAELDKVVLAAITLLEPGNATPSTEKRKKMQQDATELVGDALYEGNNFQKIRDTLRRKELLSFGAAIGLRTVQRYRNNGIQAEASRLGEFLLEEFPAAKETPEILNATASAYEAQKKKNQQIYILEQLSMLMPAQSLWRARHKEDFAVIRNMEKLAKDGTLQVAANYYDHGLSTGNGKSFNSAASFYDILVEHSPNSDEANQWRLRIANCHYFSGNLDEAFRRYAELKTKFKVDRSILEIASYQEVLTHEKRWRNAFEKSVTKGDDPLKDGETLMALEAMEKAIDEFANRFPSQSRAVDLLLVGGSTNRDQERYDNASRFWQRALVSGPTPSQRAIAIRGLVFANMKNGAPSDVIASAGKFLKLEDWNALGLTLGTELKGVLATATLDEGARLNKDGKVFEAGSLMVAIAKEFPDIPRRDKIFRDGAYMLAIAGYWAEAQNAAENYLKTKLVASRADMLYLLARSNEYQIRLQEAAKTYVDVGQRYPKHPRSLQSLQRAEALAVAEGDFKLAAQATALLAERLASQQDKLSALSRSVDYSNRAEDPRKAVNMAQRRLEVSKSDEERFRSQLLLAKSEFVMGREQQSVDDLEILSKRLDQQRTALGSSFAGLSGETNYLLGEEARKKFDDFKLFERSGSSSSKVAEKTRLFEELVSRYNKSAVAGEPSFAAQSRHRLAEAAESFADEIAAIPVKSDTNVTLKSQTRYNETVKRLRDLARKYFTDNVLSQRRNPSAYRNNEWVKRSAIKLSAYGDNSWEAKAQDVTPASARMELPQTYNLH